METLRSTELIENNFSGPSREQAAPHLKVTQSNRLKSQNDSLGPKQSSLLWVQSYIGVQLCLKRQLSLAQRELLFQRTVESHFLRPLALPGGATMKRSQSELLTSKIRTLDLELASLQVRGEPSTKVPVEYDSSTSDIA